MLKIGLFGLGTVGRGLMSIIQNHGDQLQISAVVDRSWKNKKDILDGIPASDDPEFIINNKEIDIYVELTGGMELPLYIAREAIDRKKPFITANKALLAEHGYTLFSRAALAGIQIGYEAAVAGALPVIRNLRDILGYQKIEIMQGILNGTTNYILTKMRTDKKEYDEVLSDAQKLGLAEADPTLDVSGMDAVHKLALLSSLVTGSWFEYRNIPTRGIEQLQAADTAWAARMGYRIRLVAEFLKTDGNYFASVEPAMIYDGSFLWDVENEYNALMVRGSISGDHLFVGKGAGSLPTAYSVLTDLLNLSRSPVPGMQLSRGYARLGIHGELSHEFYIRLVVANKPGVLAKISGVLSENGISIAAVHQEADYSGIESAPIDLVIITHRCKTAAFLKALDLISKSDYNSGLPVYLPIKNV